MLSLIVATGINGEIGKDNKLMWKLKNDLSFFKAVTSFKTIIMGRKTFESLPKILPNRKHIVLTNDKEYTCDDPNVSICNDYNEIIERFKNSNEEAFIIGGEQIYKLFVPHVTKVYHTLVHSAFPDADAVFKIGKRLKNFSLTDKEQYRKDINNDFNHTISIYVK